MDRYISLREVLSNVLDHPLLSDVTMDRAITYTVNFMRIVGCPNIFNDKCCTVDIEEYRGVLPDDVNTITQVRTVPKNNNYTVFRYATDAYHISNNKQDSIDYTYKVQGGFIYTSIKEGQIEVSYSAIEVDDCGYPMIPDNSSFIRALELYIKKQCFTILFDLGKINANVFSQVCQDYAWAVGQAQTSLIKPTYDQMQSISNLIGQTLSINHHSNGFINLGSKL